MAEFVRIKMDLIHDRNSNILLSLHDSRIKKITFRNNVLILHLNKIFQYTKAGEKIYFGEVLFYDIDLDECSILIFDRTVYEGNFSGKAISLIEYILRILYNIYRMDLGRRTRPCISNYVYLEYR